MWILHTFQYFDHNFLLKVLDCNEIDGVGKLIKTKTNISEIGFSYF
jgi:hypothetical protein